jgi:hypothetical protein
MEMIPAQLIKSQCGNAYTVVVNQMPLGDLHDYAMMIKGFTVERMMNVHKEELEIAEQQKQASSCESE